MEKLYENLKKFNSNELDEILDKRDSDPFDSAWCNLNESIPEINGPLNTEEIFLKLSEITKAHEVCSYISDDLQLIDRAEKIGIMSEFLNYLKESYAQGKIPSEWHS